MNALRISSLLEGTSAPSDIVGDVQSESGTSLARTQDEGAPGVH